MTTLPQTTPMRLPRPSSGSSSLAAPAAISVPASGGSSPGFSMTGSDVWRVIRANMWLIVIFVVVAGTSGFYLNSYLEKYYSKYTGLGWAQILPTQIIDPLNKQQFGQDMQSLTIEKNTQAQLITSDSLLNKVLSDSTNPIRQTSWFTVTCDGNPQKAHRLLSENLSAVPKAESQLISISFSASVPKDTKIIIQSVVDEAIREKRESLRNKNVADRSRLLELKNRYETALRNVTSDVDAMARELNLRGAEVSGSAGAKEIELVEQVKASLLAQTAYNAADSNYNATMTQIKQGQTPPRVMQMVNQDSGIVPLRSQLEQFDVNLEEMKGRLMASNPTIIDRQRDRDNLAQRLSDKVAEKTADYTEQFKSELATERDSAKKSLDAINSGLTDVRKDMGDIGNKMAAYLSKKQEQQMDHELVQQYSKALDDMDVMVRNLDFSSLDWAQYPIEPSTPSFPKLPATMGGAIAVGLMLSLGIAFLREITDTTVRSPRDIQRVGQMSLLGMVPHESDDPQASGCRLPLVIFEAPHSMMAEQFRQVRTRLQHAASLDTTRSILVTSPSPGDGKSTVAVNLAAGLALNGRRILLVDSNFRRPELHRIFGVGNEAGFSDVLNDINAFAGVIKETTVPNLSVMPSGPKPSNPTELLESQLLLDFIERCLEEYDHVVFDSGPMLFVSESVALAPRVDGVVTVIRARTNTRGVLTRMRDTLRGVKAEHLGVVLNGVRSQAGGYYGRSIKTYYEYQNAT